MPAQSTPDDVTRGDTPTYHFDITLEAGRTLAKAWMTCKVNVADADPGVFQVAITSFGTVTTNPDSSTTTQCFFKLTTTQSQGIPLSATGFDVQVKLDNGDIITPIKGTLKAVDGFTTTTT